LTLRDQSVGHAEGTATVAPGGDRCAELDTILLGLIRRMGDAATAERLDRSLPLRSHCPMDWTWPMSGAALWVLDRVRAFHQTRRRVRVLVRDGFFMHGIGASPLTTPPNVLTSPPATGYASGRQEVVRYYFMKVTNLSADREIELTHAWFTGAPGEMLLTRRPLSVRLAVDETWEGWLNAATLAHVRNVERSGRALIAGRRRPIKSRLNKGVPPVGYVAEPAEH
jgi:hypothetical protein